MHKKRGNRKRFFESRKESKKGVSLMVGYVLLVVFAIIIGGIVYVWLKTYVPRQALECPEGVSVFIKQASFDSDTSQLVITLKNNGRFNLAGFFIHTKNNSEQKLSTIDLSGYLNETGGGKIFGSSVLFAEGGENSFEPGSEDTYYFDIPDPIGELYSVQIIPTRFEEVEGRSRFTSCSDSIAEQVIGAPYVCVPNTCESLGYVCGSWSDGCGGTLDCLPGCTLPEVCDSNGQCVAPEECNDTCATYGHECGIWEICGEMTECGTCTAPEVCGVEGLCVLQCTDTCVTYGYECGIWEICGESTDCGTCDSGFTCNAEGQCIQTETQIAYFGFESGTQGWTDPGANSDRSSTRSKVLDNGADGGTYSWHIQDGTPSSTFYQNFDFTGYTSVIIKWWAYYDGIDSDADKNECMELQIDNVMVESWGYPASSVVCTHDIHTQNDQWLDEEVTISSTDYAFDSSVKVGFVGKMDQSTDDIYFDGLKITGII